MTYYLLHLDESHSDQTRIWSLCGVCVPIDKYDEVRCAFYDVIRFLIQPDSTTIETSPPELHGAYFLRDVHGVDDQRRIEVARDVADLVVQQRLPVLRYGRRYQAGDKPDSGTLKIGTWGGLRLRLMERAQDEKFIPIMDGFDGETVREMSGLVRGMDVLHAAGAGDPTDHGFRQIIGEVFYSDSRYSIMGQVADMVGYLRHVTDKQSAGLSLSGFARDLAAISSRLDSAISVEIIDDIRSSATTLNGRGDR